MARYLPASGHDAGDARARIRPIMRALDREYRETETALHFRNPFELLISVIMSAQTTDDTVNRVTPALFERYPTPADLAAADPGEVEALIKPTGFFRQKTRAIIGCARKLVEDHGGEVPRTMEELTALPGAARKTANVVMANLWPGTGHGIFVDTHVRRTSQRLALTPSDDPVKIERDLMDLIPARRWHDIPHKLILLGRGPCDARSPDHEGCPLLRWCPTGQAVVGPAIRRPRRQS
ncbi:MAG TPA: endonuclease III [Actinomycetota bacterium]|nr:endonuclease III [Actinomycetota bacterium]